MGALNKKVSEASQLLSSKILSFGVAPVMSDEKPVVKQHQLRNSTFLGETETPQFDR